MNRLVRGFQIILQILTGPLYFVILVPVIAFSILGHIVEGIQAPNEVRLLLIIVCAFAIIKYITERNEKRIGKLSQNAALFYVLFSIGSLLLDMSLDENTQAHNALMSIGTGLLGSAITLLIVNGIIRQESTSDPKILTAISENQQQMARIEAALNKLSQPDKQAISNAHSSKPSKRKRRR